MYLPVVPVGQAAAFRTNHAFVPSPPEGFRILERPARHVTVCPIVGLAVVLSLAGAGWYSSRTLGNDLKQAVEVIAP